MKPFNPHRKSQQLRRFKPTRKPAGIFSVSIVFSDAALLALAFFLAVSPFIMQPGINIKLPTAPFSGGTPFSAMVLSITHGGWFYFDDERLDAPRLTIALETAATEKPGTPLIIEADERVLLGTIVVAWNAAHNAGISEVSIATRNTTATGETP